jgi:hypothetical protein
MAEGLRAELFWDEVDLTRDASAYRWDELSMGE